VRAGRVAFVASKLQNSESGAGSLSLRGKARRSQIEADQETSIIHEGGAVATGPPAGGGWRRRRLEDGCT